GNVHHTPVLHIHGRTFPVQEFFRNDYNTKVSEYSIAIFNHVYSNDCSNNNSNNDDDDYDNDYDGNDDDNYNNNNRYKNDIQSRKSVGYLSGGPRGQGDIDFDMITRLILCLVSKLDGSSNSNNNNDEVMLHQATGTL